MGPYHRVVQHNSHIFKKEMLLSLSFPLSLFLSFSLSLSPSLSISLSLSLVGRLHGGVGFVCKPMQGIVYKPIDIECDKMMALQLINNGKPVLNILVVYLPCFDG